MYGSQSKSGLATADISQFLWYWKTVRISHPHESDQQPYPSSFWTILILSISACRNPTTFCHVTEIQCMVWCIDVYLVTKCFLSIVFNLSYIWLNFQSANLSFVLYYKGLLTTYLYRTTHNGMYMCGSDLTWSRDCHICVVRYNKNNSQERIIWPPISRCTHRSSLKSFRYLPGQTHMGNHKETRR
jgi:hypothetical protein